MSREHRRARDLDHAAKGVGPGPAVEVEDWPGKRSLTMELATRSALSAPEPGALAETPANELGRDDDVERLDLRVAELRRETVSTDEAEQQLWIAQQHRGERWKQVLAWASEHRAQRDRNR